MSSLQKTAIRRIRSAWGSALCIVFLIALLGAPSICGAFPGIRANEPISVAPGDANCFTNTGAPPLGGGGGGGGGGTSVTSFSDGVATSEREETLQIRQLASSLDNDPRLIYEYLRNHIEYVPSFGCRKGATATLLAGRGNTLEVAILLRALLHAADPSMPIYYGQGSVVYTKAFMGNLLGVNEDQIVDYLSVCGIAVSNYSTSAIAMNHFWTIAYVDGAWRHLNAAFHEMERASPMDLASAMDFDRTEFLTQALSGTTEGASSIKDVNEDQIRDELEDRTTCLLSYLSTNCPNASVDELLGGSSIKPESVSTLDMSPAYFVENLGWDYGGELTSNGVWRMTVLYQGIDYTTNTYAFAGKRMTLFHSGAYGAPELRIGGELVATGSSTSEGEENLMTLIVERPLQKAMTNTYSLVGCKSYALIKDFETESPALLAVHNRALDAARRRDAADSSEEVLGGALNLMGMTYARQWRQDARMAGQLTETPQSLQIMQGVMAQETGYYVDVPNCRYAFINKSGDTAVEESWFGCVALLGSAFEHGILEQMQGTNNPGISTARILTLNNADGHETYSGAATNWYGTGGIRANLVNYTTPELTSLDDYIDAGYDVVVPKRGDTGMGLWAGAGYVIHKSGTIGMLIDGGYNGGYSSTSGEINSVPVTAQTTISVSPPPPANQTNPRGADPVDLATADYLFEKADLSLGSGTPLGLHLRRFYNSGQRFHDGPLGFGWTHSYDIHLDVHSHGDPGLGLRQPKDAAPYLVYHTIAMALFQNETPLRAWVISSMAAKWLTDQLTENAVTLTLGNKSLEYLRMPDGSYTPPAGVTAQLIKTNGLYQLRERFGKTTEFNADGYASAIEDSDGRETTFAYNAQTNLTSVTDAFGREMTFAYNAEHRISSASDSTDRTVQYVYGDGRGNLNWIGDPESNWSRFIYDTNHCATVVVDSMGQTIVSNRYDELGKVTNQLDAAGDPWNFYVVEKYRGVEEAPDAGRTTYYFDSIGRQIVKEDALGNRQERSYDGQNHVTNQVDAMGNITAHFYDANHNRTNTIDALANSWTFVYDADHHMISSADPLGNSTHSAYDDEHHLTNVVDALTNQIVSSYYPTGLLHSVSSALSVVTYTYDSYGNPTTIARTDGGTATNVWNERGDLLVATDANGESTTMTYDKRRLLTSVTDALGNTVSNIYNDVGLLVETIDQRGNSISTTYTPMNKVSTIAYPDGSVVSNTYDSADRLIAVTDGRGNTTTIAYDKAGKRIAATNALGHATHYAFDSNGNLIATTNALGHVTHVTVDALNRVTNTWDTVGGQTRSNATEFDIAGRQIAAVNALAQRTQFARDPLGRITTTTRPDLKTEQNQYDSHGNLLRFTNAKGEPVARTGYDAMSRPITRTNALGNVHSWTYDTVGNQLTRTDAKGEETEYAFDVLNRLTAIEYPDDSVAGFTHDPAGNLLTATNNAATLTFGYDEMHRVSAVTQSVLSVSSVVEYSHDYNGNRTGLTYPGNKTVTYTYDEANRLSGIQLSAFSLQPFSFTYDDANRLTGITYPNGVAATYGHDEAGRLTSLEYADGATPFIERTNTLNTIGQITAIQTDAGMEATPPDTQQHHQHSAADQLTHVSRMDDYENPERWRDVGPDCDANGAITNISATYNGINATETLTWDYDGHLKTFNGPLQTNLWFAMPPLPKSLSFRTDALGNRVARADGSKETIHVLDQAATLKNILVEMTSTGTVARTYIYAPGFGLMAHIDADGTARYYHGDHLGSTIAITDANGDVTDEFVYTPYGELIDRSGTTDTPYTFCGRHGVYWEGGHLYHMKARYYRADIARFISSDPIGIVGGANLYAYANGDPVRFLDALGLCADSGVIRTTPWYNQGVEGYIYNTSLSMVNTLVVEPYNTAQDAHYGRNQYQDGLLPSEPDVAQDLSWDDSVEPMYHQQNGASENDKWVSPDGHMEVIFDGDGGIVTDDANTGTYNFSDPSGSPLGHFFQDMLPYYFWGNTPSDSTPVINRVFGP